MTTLNHVLASVFRNFADYLDVQDWTPPPPPVVPERPKGFRPSYPFKLVYASLVILIITADVGDPWLPLGPRSFGQYMVRAVRGEIP